MKTYRLISIDRAEDEDKSLVIDIKSHKSANADSTEQLTRNRGFRFNSENYVQHKTVQKISFFPDFEQCRFLLCHEDIPVNRTEP